ncbi:acetyl-coenzyme A synthetase 2 [Paramarasmius palmivorus]|uniref:acetate--CoA ligase n=1 Tax=Paramarasmius palmivorus TaxID=297713 RepID=A0AAW0BNX1_9AGAR
MSETEVIPTHPVGSRVTKDGIKPHVGPDKAAYEALHSKTVGEGSDEWWAEVRVATPGRLARYGLIPESKTARNTLHWDTPFHTVRSGSFAEGNISWFPEGTLNAAYNCVDRHAFKDPNRTAIIYEADEPDQHKYISYGQLLNEVSRVANVLKSLGIKRGDTVSVYLPMTWEAVAVFLACARIGAIHSVVFAGFSSESLRDRILDCRSRVLITTDEGKRGGKTIATKKIVDVALDECAKEPGGNPVEKVLVLKRTGSEVNMEKGRDLWWHEEVAKVPSYCPCESMKSEDPLFILYTSGSTGKPKGVVHTTGGYLLGAALTVKYVFDVHPGDKFACMADIGWITGHTYIVYGPLLNGVSTTIFESTPVYPTPSRYWETVAKHKLTHFYSAPTAIRLLRRLGHQHVEGHDLSSIRILGSVGEPINPEAWNWYNEYVGKKQCAIVDTFWNSRGPNVEGVLAIKAPWPSIARTIWGDHARYVDVYMKPYPGYYFTGDGAARDEDGYIWIKGRVDDVINVSGHRLSTAEIESALIMHTGVAETAVIGTADELTGQAVYAFVTLKPEYKYDPSNEEALTKELVLQVRKVIGPFAAPKKVFIVGDLPKTRSGKIMRRIMRKIVAGEGDQLGDLSTVAEPGVVDVIKKKVADVMGTKL